MIVSTGFAGQAAPLMQRNPGVRKRLAIGGRLPRHPTGTLYKRLLRERYWAGRDRKL